MGRTGSRSARWSVDPELAPVPRRPGHPVLLRGGRLDGRRRGNILKPLDGEITVARGFSTPLTDIEMARIAHEAQPGIDLVLPAVRAVSGPDDEARRVWSPRSRRSSRSTTPASSTATSVTVLGPWGDEVASTTGAAGVFTPQLPGKYTLEYSATDGAGNDNSRAVLRDRRARGDLRRRATWLRPPTFSTSTSGTPVAPASPTAPTSPTTRPTTASFTRVTGAPITMDEELGKPVATFANSDDLSYRTAWSESDYALQNDGYAFEATFNMSSSAPWDRLPEHLQQPGGRGVGFDAYEIDSGDCFLPEEQKAGHDYCVTLWREPSADDRLSVATRLRHLVPGRRDERPHPGAPLRQRRARRRGGWREGAVHAGGRRGPTGSSAATPASGNRVSNPFTGMISSARIWSNPLTPDHVAALLRGVHEPR